MKKQKLSLGLYLVLISVLVVGSILATYFVVNENRETVRSKPAVVDACMMTNQMKSEIANLYNPMSQKNIAAGAPEPPSQDSTSELVGLCEYDTLKKAYELGARELRDLSDCGEGCFVTDDLRNYRITYKQVDGVIESIEVG